METIASVARKLIDGPPLIRETNGKNRSPFIDHLCQEFGVPLGSPYCAMGVSHCAKVCQWRTGTVFPYSDGSQAIMRHFRDNGHLFTDPQQLLGVKGALGGWTDPDKEHGHIFVIEGRLTGFDGVRGLETLEFNTSPVNQGRDGEGAFAMTRTITQLKAHHPNFWFLDTSGVRGGAWW